MTTATEAPIAALPDALVQPARAFVSQPHRLLIGAERPEAADGRTFATLDPATGREIAEVAQAGERRRRAAPSAPLGRRSPTGRGRRCRRPGASS